MINRKIRIYLRQNKVSKEEIEFINYVKKEVFKLLRVNSIEKAEKIRDKLINLDCRDNKLVYAILWKFVIPYFKNLTYHLEDKNIESTNNKIENVFQKIFPKSIKRLMRSTDGVLQRFLLNQVQWEVHNGFYENHLSF